MGGTQGYFHSRKYQSIGICQSHRPKLKSWYHVPSGFFFEDFAWCAFTVGIGMRIWLAGEVISYDWRNLGRVADWACWRIYGEDSWGIRCHKEYCKPTPENLPMARCLDFGHQN